MVTTAGITIDGQYSRTNFQIRFTFSPPLAAHRKQQANKRDGNRRYQTKNQEHGAIRLTVPVVAQRKKQCRARPRRARRPPRGTQATSFPFSPPNLVNLTGRETGGTMGKNKESKENHTYHPRLRAGATRQHRGACSCATVLGERVHIRLVTPVVA